MQQVTIYSSGESGSLRIPRMQTTLPATPHVRTKQKSFDMKATSTCLLLGGKIKATLPEISHVDSVGPEPGVGYGLSRRYPGHQRKKNDLQRVVGFAVCGSGRSSWAPCS